MFWIKLILGYLFSLCLGTIATWYASHFLHSLIEIEKTEKDSNITDIITIEWMPPAIGFLERLLITTLVGFNVPGAASFMAAWVALKALHGWGRTKSYDSIYVRGKLFVGFINSLISMIFAVFGGLIFRCAT